MAIETAICVPNSCDTADLNDLNITNYLNKITNMKNLVKTLPDISVNCLPEFTPLNTASVVFIVLVSIVTALLLVGTGYDAYVRYNSCSKSSEKLTNGEASSANNSQPINDERQLVVVRKKTWIGEFLMCFSVWKNGESLLDTSIKPGQLNCIHGIRFISMTWIILGHTYVSRVGVVGNLLDVLGQFNNLPFMTIIGGQYSVDTFFFLSGFLLSYLFLKDKNTFTLKKLGDFYIHRYIRLTPVYMVVLFALASLYNFIGDGPVWMYQDRKSNLCIKYWWRNILYMNNLFPGSENCCSWSWYLANDMQFYIISPLFLVLMKSKSRKWRYVGLAIVLALLLTTWITTIIIVIVNQFRADLNTNALATGDLYNKIYNKPWTRIGPYLIGCLLGYVMVNFKDKRRLFLTRYWNILWWSSAFGLALVVVYGVFKANFTLTSGAFYYGLSRSAWAIAIAWVIFACQTGRGGPINKFLSWEFFFPLSRLTYCAYLVHPMVLMYYFFRLRSPIMLTGTFVTIHYLGFTVLSYGVAFITSLAFESPIIRLEKLLREGVKP